MSIWKNKSGLVFFSFLRLYIFVTVFSLELHWFCYSFMCECSVFIWSNSSLIFEFHQNCNKWYDTSVSTIMMTAQVIERTMVNVALNVIVTVPSKMFLINRFSQHCHCKKFLRSFKNAFCGQIFSKLSLQKVVFWWYVNKINKSKILHLRSVLYILKCTSYFK